MYLLRPADLPDNKPRNAAEAIARQMVKQAVGGCTTSQATIYDRIEGKAIATIKAEIEHKPLDLMDAARRLAFLINSANLLGEAIDPALAALASPLPDEKAPVIIDVELDSER